MGRAKKKRLLRRDDWCCGIHLGGCGKALTVAETTLDHILPRVMGGASLNQNPKEDERNLQPMCERCNQRRGSEFPKVPMVSRCPCCRWLFIVDVRTARAGKDGKDTTFQGERADRVWRPVLPMDNRRPTTVRRAALLRETKVDGRHSYIVTPSGPPSSLHDESGPVLLAGVHFFWLGLRKDGHVIAGLSGERHGASIGGVLTVPEMLHHNLHRMAAVASCWKRAQHLLSDEEHASLWAWMNGDDRPGVEPKNLLGLSPFGTTVESINAFVEREKAESMERERWLGDKHPRLSPKGDPSEFYRRFTSRTNESKSHSSSM